MDEEYAVVLIDGESALGKGFVNDISYVKYSWDGAALTSAEVTTDAQVFPADGAMTSGWYYLDRSITLNKRISSITGDVDLILGDGYTLDVKGISVPAGTTLTVYGQSAGTGKIKSSPSGGAGIVVAFDTDNTLRVTFKTDGSRPLGGYTFLLDGTETVPRKSGKNGYLQVKNIAAPNLDTPHTFTVTDGTNTYTVTASALSYAYTSVKNGDSDRQNLGKALYLYNQAADAHFVS